MQDYISSSQDITCRIADTVLYMDLTTHIPKESTFFIKH